MVGMRWDERRAVQGREGGRSERGLTGLCVCQLLAAWENHEHGRSLLGDPKARLNLVLRGGWEALAT